MEASQFQHLKNGKRHWITQFLSLFMGGHVADTLTVYSIFLHRMNPRMNNPAENKIVLMRRAKGFTLLELLVVMVIIGLLAGYVGPKYFSQIGKSEVKATRAQLDAFGKALDQYRLDTGHYPSTEMGMNALMVKPANEPKWDGPYLTKALPADPWGNAYQYRQPGEHGDYDLFSYGKDGQAGGEGENADINNW